MSILYVVSDRPGAGKTAICMALAKLLRAQSKSVVAVKPVADGENDPDAGIYAQMLGADTNGLPVADASAVDEISDVVRSLSEDNDIVILEGSNSLTATQSQSIADAIDAKVLVVAGYDASLSHGVVTATGAPYGGRVIGYIINGVTQYMGTDARANLAPQIAAQASNRGARSAWADTGGQAAAGRERQPDSGAPRRRVHWRRSRG